MFWMRHLNLPRLPVAPFERPTEPLPGPSEYTAAEYQALGTFGERAMPSLPHLVGFKKTTQGSEGALSGGYIVYTMMTLMPGRDLLDLKFWSMSESDRSAIRLAFISLLK